MIIMNFKNNENTSWNALSPTSINELISNINTFTPKYRSSLNFLPSKNNDITFGVELEYEDVLQIFIKNYITKNYPLWEPKNDDSLTNGGEIASPVLTNNKETWSELSQICAYLAKKNVNTAKNASCHIHIGAHLLGSDISKWLTFLKVYTIYEPVIFHFALGDKTKIRAGFYHYAYPTSIEILGALTILNKNSRMIDLMYYLPRQSRNQSLNFKNFDYCNPDKLAPRNTLEFRSPHATTNEIIIQNYLNTFTKLVLCPSNTSIDEDYLDYKLKKQTFNFHKEDYTKIDLQKALEFIDLIFDNNLDKAYFLYQYLNNFSSPPTPNTSFFKRILT